MRKTTTTLLFFGATALAPVASAHLTLTSPPARHPASDLKFGPCGVESNDARSTDPAKITTYTAGETITVEWTEVIDHDPSHYRIAFSREGDAFSDPTGFDDIETVYPELLDGIPDADAGNGYEYSVEVTLPNEPCDLCSLQVIQVMHDKPPWGPDGGDDIYYQCADIVLLEDPNNPPEDPIPPGDGGAPSVDGTGGAELATGGAEFGTGGAEFGTGGALTGAGGQVVDPASGGAAAAGGATAGVGGSDAAASGGTSDPEGPESGSTSSAEDTAGGCNFDPTAPRPTWSALLLLAACLNVRRRRTASMSKGE